MRAALRAMAVGIRTGRRAAGLALALALGTACLAADNDGTAPAPRTGPLIVVGDADYPPYLFLDDEGRPVGLVADAWALWSRKTGIPVDLQALNWAEAQQRVVDGRAQVIDTLVRTPEREGLYDFSLPYADVPAQIFARNDVSGLTELRALRPMRVGAMTGDACVERLRDGGVARIDTYPNYEQVIDAAVAGQVKVFCMSRPAAEYLLFKADAGDRFHRAFDLFHGELHRAVRHGDTATLEVVERGFDDFTVEERRALDDKWLGAPLLGFPWQRTLRAIALALILAIVIAVLWGLTLRRAVREKTTLIDSERHRLSILITQRQADEHHLRRLNRLYGVLTSVHAAIAGEQAAAPLFAAICRIMVDEGGLLMAWVGQPDPAHGILAPVASAGAVGNYLEPPHASLAPGPHGYASSVTAWREGRPVHATDVREDPAFAPWRDAALALGFVSSSAYPLRCRERTVAVFTMYSGTAEFFDAGELALLDRLSSDIGRALETYELNVERDLAETALRESEARFAMMFKTNATAMALVRFDSKRVLDANDTFLSMFGFTLDEVIGRDGEELRIWVDLDFRARAMRRIGDGPGLRNVEAEFSRSDGTPFPALFSATRVSIGHEDLIIVSYADLTAQRLVTRTLEERQAELEQIVSRRTAELSTILDAMPDLTFRVRADFTILSYRSGRKVQLFADPQTFLHRKVRDVLPAESADKIEAAITEALRHPGIVLVEYALPFPKGEQFFEARILQQEADQVIAFVRNITDRHTLEADRENARLRAEELATAKSEFLANMSHEIRTPLNGLLGLAQIGERSSADSGTRETFGAIVASGRLLLGIVNDVLDFSRIEVGKLRVEQRPMSPAAVAEAAVALLRERAAEKHIALESQVDPALPAECLGDALRTQQVLVNLISNAVKFTEQGGVGVWVGRDAARDLVFRVTDSGIGIPPEQLPLIFTAFQQADTSTTRRFGGTGLGLAISRRLAELMGGVIRVRSVAGEGSRFELSLPWIDPTPAPPAPREPAAWPDAPRRLGGIRVLIAEDNEVNQIVLERALVMEGAQVTIVGDGLQAVNRVLADGRAAFDVVLMDIQMPVMDGYEATRRILEIAPDLPVIGQTAHAMQEERRECLAAGMVDHIAKPIDFRQLVDMIVRHLG